MSPSSSCLRCNQALAIESANGLCVTCSKALETSRDISSRTPAPFDETASQPELVGATLTHAAAGQLGPTLETGTDHWDGQVRFSNSPAGYDLFRYLGGGGMGDVYLAREHAAERIVAMKFLRGSPHSNSATRFLTEVRALGRLDHPNIVRVISVDLERADPHFTMEFAPGGTLSDRVKANGPYAPKEAARIVAQISRAIDLAHGLKIVHRDLKPSNIVFGANDVPKVTDFGLAKLTDRDDGVSMSTGPLGTPSFMPPEQISSKFGQVSPASDVYSLGATLYCLLTARPPFQGDSHQDIITKVQTEQAERVSSVRPEVPGELEGIVVKCLEKDPRHRYPTALALAEDLERFIVGKDPLAPRQTRLRRVRRWVGRNRWALGRWLVAISLIAALSYFGKLFSPIAQTDSQAKDPLKEIEEELAAGKKVKLLGGTGLPRWWRFHYLPSTLGPSNQTDKACSFQSADLSLLELLPDLGIAKYRVRAEIQHLGATSARIPQAQVGLDNIGLYFGGDMVPTADGRDLATLFAVRFNDFTPIPMAGQTLVVPQVGLQPGFVVQSGRGGNRGPGMFWELPESVNFTPTPARPGSWRAIEIDVSPDAVAGRWYESPNEKPITIAQWSGDEARTRYASMQAMMNRVIPGHMVRPWQPGRSLGIWCYQSAVAFRNITIEPLP